MFLFAGAVATWPRDPAYRYRRRLPSPRRSPSRSRWTLCPSPIPAVARRARPQRSATAADHRDQQPGPEEQDRGQRDRPHLSALRTLGLSPLKRAVPSPPCGAAPEAGRRGTGVPAARPIKRRDGSAPHGTVAPRLTRRASARPPRPRASAPPARPYPPHAAQAAPWRTVRTPTSTANTSPTPPAIQDANPSVRQPSRASRRRAATERTARVRVRPVGADRP